MAYRGPWIDPVRWRGEKGLTSENSPYAKMARAVVGHHHFNIMRARRNGAPARYWKHSWVIDTKNGERVRVRAVWDGAVMNIAVDVSLTTMIAESASTATFQFEVIDAIGVLTGVHAIGLEGGVWSVIDDYDGASLTRQDRSFVGRIPYSYKVFNTVHGVANLALSQSVSTVRRAGETLTDLGYSHVYGVGERDDGGFVLVRRTGGNTFEFRNGAFAEPGGLLVSDAIGSFVEPRGGLVHSGTSLRGFYFNKAADEALHVVDNYTDTPGRAALLRVSTDSLTAAVEAETVVENVSTGGGVTEVGIEGQPTSSLLVIPSSYGSLITSGGGIISLSGSWSESASGAYSSSGTIVYEGHTLGGATFPVTSTWSLSGQDIDHGDGTYTRTREVAVSTSFLGQSGTATGSCSISWGYNINGDPVVSSFTGNWSYTLPSVLAPVLSGGSPDGTLWALVATETGSGANVSSRTFSAPAWLSASYAGTGIGINIAGVGVINPTNLVKANVSGSVVPGTTGWRGPVGPGFAKPTAFQNDGVFSRYGIRDSFPGPTRIDWTYSYSKTPAQSGSITKHIAAGDFTPNNDVRIARVHDTDVVVGAAETKSGTYATYRTDSHIYYEVDATSTTGGYEDREDELIYHDDEELGGARLRATMSSVVASATTTYLVFDPDEPVFDNRWDFNRVVTSITSSMGGIYTVTQDEKLLLLFADPRIKFYIWSVQSKPAGSSYYTNSVVHVRLLDQTFGPYEIGTQYVAPTAQFFSATIPSLQTCATAIISGVWWALVILNNRDGSSFGRLLSSEGAEIDLSDVLTEDLDIHRAVNVTHVQ